MRLKYRKYRRARLDASYASHTLIDSGTDDYLFSAEVEGKEEIEIEDKLKLSITSLIK